MPTVSSLLSHLLRLSIARLGNRPTWEERAVILLDGDTSINDHPLKPFDLPVFDRSSTVNLRSTTGAHLLLFGGEHFGSDRYIAGNFVASSPEIIEQWVTDYQTGNFARIERHGEAQS